MRVLGVDPGLTRCGLGVVDGGVGRSITGVAVDVVRTPVEAEVAQRLLRIGDAVEEWLDTYRPDVVAVERVFSQHNVRTVMGTAQAGGVVALCAARRETRLLIATCADIAAFDQVSARPVRLPYRGYRTAPRPRTRRAEQARSPYAAAAAADAAAATAPHDWIVSAALLGHGRGARPH